MTSNSGQQSAKKATVTAHTHKLTSQFLDPLWAQVKLVRIATDIVQQLLVSDQQFLQGKWAAGSPKEQHEVTESNREIAHRCPWAISISSAPLHSQKGGEDVPGVLQYLTKYKEHKTVSRTSCQLLHGHESWQLKDEGQKLSSVYTYEGMMFCHTSWLTSSAITKGLPTSADTMNSTRHNVRIQYCSHTHMGQTKTYTKMPPHRSWLAIDQQLSISIHASAHTQSCLPNVSKCLASYNTDSHTSHLDTNTNLRRGQLQEEYHSISSTHSTAASTTP